MAVTSHWSGKKTIRGITYTVGTGTFKCAASNVRGASDSEGAPQQSITLTKGNTYRLRGWAEGDKVTHEYSIGTTAASSNIGWFTEDIFPYATYTITYKPGSNGTGSQQTQTKTYGTNITLKGAIFTRAGYTQTGWSTSNGGSKTHNLNASYTSNDGLTLYPVWTAKTYSVTYSANGVSGYKDLPESETGLTSTSYTIPTTVPYKYNKAMYGYGVGSTSWTGQYPGSDITLSKTSTTINCCWEDPTTIYLDTPITSSYYFKYQRRVYKFTTGSVAKKYLITVTSDENIDLYVYKNSNTAIASSRTSGDESLTVELAASTTYYLHAKTYADVHYDNDSTSTTGTITIEEVSTSTPSTIKYNLNGGSCNTTLSNQTASSDDGSITAHPAVPYKFKYTFLGWSQDSSANSWEDVWFQPGGYFSVSPDLGTVDVYAVWGDPIELVDGSYEYADIEFAGQEIYYKISPSKTTKYVFSADYRSNKSIDPVAKLYNSSQTQIASGDDENGNRLFELTTEVDAGTYYLKIYDHYVSYTGQIGFQVTAEEEQILYTVTYDTDGGSLISDRIVQAGTVISLPSAPTPPTNYIYNTYIPITISYTPDYGSVSSQSDYAIETKEREYYFYCWDIDGSDYNPGDYITVNSNITVTAIWDYTTSTQGTTSAKITIQDGPDRPNDTAGSYTVSFAQNGGTSKPSDITATITRQYSFSHWYDPQGYTYYPGSVRAFYTDMTLDDIWSYTDTVSSITLPTGTSKSNTSASGYTVTYNANGGSGAPSNTTSGNRAITHTFNKWRLNSTSGTAYSAGAPYTPSANCTFYPTWTSSTSSNSSWTCSSTKPTRTGYKFLGWSTSSSAKTATYKASTTYTITSALTLYAVWTPVTYTVSYTLNSGSISGQKTSYTIETDSFTLPIPTRTGYYFTGWTGSNGTTPQRTVTISKGSTGNKSYTANWVAKKVTVNFYRNHTSSDTTLLGSQTFTYGVSNQKFTITGSKTGYSPSAWNTKKDASGTSYTYSNYAVTNTFITNQHSGLDKETVTLNLYLIWSINSYTLTIKPNGGKWNESTSNSSFTQNYNTTKTISPPTRDGYIFVGWFKSHKGILSNSKVKNSLFTDSSGLPGVYNNAGNNYVTHTRTADTSAGHTHIITIKTSNAAAEPDYGGFHSSVTSAANQTFIHSFKAKVPKEYKFAQANNSVGTGSTFTWLSNRDGTGDWETYAYELKCGSSGSFSSFGYVYLIEQGSVLPEWQLGGTQVTQNITENQTFTYEDGDTVLIAQWIPQGHVRIETGSGFKLAIPYIYTENGWKQAMGYVNTDGKTTGWKIGIEN